MGISLPDTKNLTGYFDPELLPPVIQDNLPTQPGFYEFSDLSNQLVLYISNQDSQTLYLVYYRGQVDALVLYYGLFPLLVSEQIERVEFLTADKEVAIRLTEKTELHIIASETVLAVMLGNLIRNAILYTDEGDIEITIDERIILISDSDPGIPQSKLKRIFEPFDRADMDEHVAGYGIGLTIVKRLCDRFGWQIQVASLADQGTSFAINFDPTAD